jgi:putative two-component system response regulator
MIRADVSAARILIADDEHSGLRLLREIATRAGYSDIRTTSDSRAVAALCREFQPDLLLLDLHMPYLDGFQVLEQLHDLIESSVFFPVLVLSADITPEARKRALIAGARDFVLKPYDTTEVMLRMRNLLETRFFAVALEREKALLEERVRTRTRELEGAQQVIVERLARAAEYRDDATGKHAQRVGDLSADIARELGMAEEDVELIRRAAPLHDLGKIGVPDDVLLKPGPLMPDERAISKQHPLIGAHILTGSDFPLLKLAEEIAVSHHERWDGAGYPLGLAGEQIPLSGRIVAVADVYDALTHSRPYKHAWASDAAIEEIRSLRSTQFDPDVVDAFLRLMRAESAGTPLRLEPVAA